MSTEEKTNIITSMTNISIEMNVQLVGYTQVCRNTAAST